jgi:hypothetical protein
MNLKKTFYHREHRGDSNIIRKKKSGGQAPKKRMKCYLLPLDFCVISLCSLWFNPPFIR